MARKQAKRRKRQKARRWRVPKIPLARIGAAAVAVSVVALTYHLSLSLLDRKITSITIEGPFQRVSALHIEEAISGELGDGFVTANLSRIQRRLVELPWVDQAQVARRWPSTLHISVTEQVAAARWGDNGLLNTRGELFVRDARHIPAELPRLSGPPDTASAVATRYLAIREQLIPLGLDVRRLNLDLRGAWELTLQNGIEIRLGRRDVEQRTDLFLDVVADIISSRESEIEFADMRYSNGFTIGWKNGTQARAPDAAPMREKLLVGRNE
jgi:cell division protein FtsQ